MKFLFLFFLVLTYAFAEDVKVIFVKGEVVINNLEGGSRKLQKGDFLKEGDTLKTGKGSITILKIEGHSNHRVEENTELMIEDLPYKFKNSEEFEQGGSVIIKMGTIVSDIMSKSDITIFKMKTRNTTMGVRGTILMVDVDRSNSDLTLMVNEGEVEISNGVSDLSDVVSRGQAMVIESDTNPTQQRHVEWAQDLDWNVGSREVKKNTFNQIRERARKLHLEKRQNWVRNELKFGKTKEKWVEREKKWVERTSTLTPNPVKEKRKKNFEEKIQKANKFFKNKLKSKMKDNSDTQSRSGNGPRRSGDRLIERNRDRIERNKNKLERFKQRNDRFPPPIRTRPPHPPNTTAPGTTAPNGESGGT